MAIFFSYDIQTIMKLLEDFNFEFHQIISTIIINGEEKKTHLNNEFYFRIIN